MYNFADVHQYTTHLLLLYIHIDIGVIYVMHPSYFINSMTGLVDMQISEPFRQKFSVEFLILW